MITIKGNLSDKAKWFCRQFSFWLENSRSKNFIYFPGFKPVHHGASLITGILFRGESSFLANMGIYYRLLMVSIVISKNFKKSGSPKTIKYWYKSYKYLHWSGAFSHENSVKYSLDIFYNFSLWILLTWIIIVHSVWIDALFLLIMVQKVSSHVRRSIVITSSIFANWISKIIF